MPEFIKINNNELEIFFQKLKIREQKSWKYISNKLGISRAMLFNYKSGKYPIPLDIFNKIKNIIKYTPNFKIITKNKFIEKKITKPKLNVELSEILGALAGDGHISNISYEVSITGSKLDKEYLEYLKPIFEKLFNLEFIISSQNSNIKLRTYSKDLALFLNKEYGLPLGKKTNKLKIPNKIKNNKELLRAYIRGLFDTDGSIYLRRKKDVVIEIISIDKNYLKEIKTALNYLGFYCGISRKNLHIYRKNLIRKFFKEIKSNNQKHLKKYKMYFQYVRR